MSCSSAARSEPLAGTAPPQPNWLFVEAPGAWGREAADALGELRPSLPDSWRLVLVRRADRPLRRQRDRFVWSSTPAGARWWRLPPDAPVVPDTPGDPVAQEMLFVCCNGGRDRCCALLGRRVVDALRSDRAWECSHLGGHRFAATGVRLSDRMLFGRLDVAAARRVLAGDTPLDQVRGPAGWEPAVQVAALAVWRQRGVVPITAGHFDGTLVRLQLHDGSQHQVRVERWSVSARPLSCGSAAEPGTALRALG